MENVVWTKGKKLEIHVPRTRCISKIFTHKNISQTPAAYIFDNSQLLFCFEPLILRNILSIAYNGKMIAHNSYFNTRIFVLIFINTWLRFSVFDSIY